MKKIFKTFAVISAIALFSSGFIACSDDEDSSTPTKDEPESAVYSLGDSFNMNDVDLYILRDEFKSSSNRAAMSLSDLEQTPVYKFANNDFIKNLCQKHLGINEFQIAANVDVEVIEDAKGNTYLVYAYILDKKGSLVGIQMFQWRWDQIVKKTSNFMGYSTPADFNAACNDVVTNCDPTAVMFWGFPELKGKTMEEFCNFLTENEINDIVDFLMTPSSELAKVLDETGFYNRKTANVDDKKFIKFDFQRESADYGKKAKLTGDEKVDFTDIQKTYSAKNSLGYVVSAAEICEWNIVNGVPTEMECWLYEPKSSMTAVKVSVEGNVNKIRAFGTGMIGNTNGLKDEEAEDDEDSSYVAEESTWTSTDSGTYTAKFGTAANQPYTNDTCDFKDYASITVTNGKPDFDAFIKKWLEAYPSFIIPSN